MATLNAISPSEANIVGKYKRGELLGRSGHSVGADRLVNVLQGLDALLCIVSDAEVDEDGKNAFQYFNSSIQRGVLKLSQELAEEAHELAVQIHCFRELP